MTYQETLKWLPRLAPSVYLSVLAVGIVLSQYANYLWFEIPIVFGQPSNILVFFAAFLVAFVLWLGTQRRKRSGGLLAAFLALMGVAWLAHLILYRFHGDSFNYTSLLYVPILAMIWWKPPQVREAWVAILSLAWTTALIISTTLLLELMGALDAKPQMAGVISFDEERYFLPLNDLLAIEGRWPGPFGHNGDTAMMGAFLIVIAVAYWTRSSWVFLMVGGLTLLITSGRASIGAALAAVVVLAMFSRNPRWARIPLGVRTWGGVAVLALGALFMYSWAAGSTGRDAFWPAFLEIWFSSPLVGIGSSGIANSGGVTEQFGHAHSLYIDELARYGLVGFLTQFGALALGIAIAFMAAKRGMAGPLAILVAYLVTGITEPRNQWISPSVTGTLLILAVVTAAASLAQNREAGGQASESEYV